MTNKKLHLKGIDANFSKVNDITKYFTGQWVEPDTYQVVVGYGLAQNSRWDYLISTIN
jgi:hypothetical protein